VTAPLAPPAWGGFGELKTRSAMGQGRCGLRVPTACVNILSIILI